jgi:dipeptidyl-peptidase-4
MIVPMKKIQVYLLLLVAALTLDISVFAQETIDSTKLSLDRIFQSGEFRQDWFGRYQWLGSGDAYTVLERSETVERGMDMVKYETKSGKSEVLIAAEKFIPSGQENPLRISGYDWSTDLNKLLIFTNTRRVWRANTRGDYWVLDLEKDTLYQLGPELPESSLMFAKFTEDGTKAAFVSKHNVFMQDLESGMVTQLTFDGTEDIINGTFDWVYEEELDCRDGFRWNPGGSHIAFWQLDATDIRDFLMINNTDSIYSYTIPVQYPKAGEDPSSARIGVIDIVSKEIQWLAIPGDPIQNYLPRLQWIGNNRILVQQLNRHQNENRLWLVNLETGDMENFYTDKDEAWVDIDHPDVAQSGRNATDMVFLDNGEEFIWISEKDGWRHLYLKSVDGSKDVLLTDGPYDIASLYGVDEKKGYVYFNASPENSTQRYLYRVELDGSGGLTRLTPEDKPGINRYDLAPGMQYAIWSSSSRTRVPTTDLVSLPKHKVVRNLVNNEAYSNKMAGIDQGIVEFFKVTTEDGVEMDGYMIKPPDFDASKKYPVLFDLYGEPWGQTATDSWGGLWHHYLAQQGYIVMTMDNRGTPCLKGREWRKSIYKNIGTLNSRDQAMATKKILEWDYIDADRIAVWGWSGGGSMTLNLMFRYPEIYSTGMAVAAVADLRYYDNIYQERYTGIPQEVPEVYEQGSPITHAKNLEGNLLIIHGTADDNVHYQSAEALIVELIKNNKKFDVMPYPNCSHGIYEIPGARTHLFTLLTDYLMEHVPAGGR